jgi:hypothetical protein
MPAHTHATSRAPLRLVNATVVRTQRPRPVVVDAPSWQVRSSNPDSAPVPAATPALAGDDPRWLLARRVYEQLGGGAALAPERRARLNMLGNRLGLRPFDISLVIAIVQDHARSRSTSDTLMARLRMIPAPDAVAADRSAPPASILPRLIVTTLLALGIVWAAAAWITH